MDAVGAEAVEVGASVVTVDVGLDAAVSVGAEEVEVGASVVTVDVGLDAAVSVGAEAVEVGASVVTVDVGLDAAVSVLSRELFNHSECFHSIPFSEFINFMCFSS
ncbi:hypothetical protein BQ8794_130050 [Mesorhizobium prunaredense]|uniref:Uncharacterized protein n=1 Tax=Mesorhizobium prunaredense TaxID=1631249 RepID=A0A1R3V0Z4_9HYPH|nr:hypothetical protein BQ8794_130050 [Mesorhizobium prunaredense]